MEVNDNDAPETGDDNQQGDAGLDIKNVKGEFSRKYDHLAQVTDQLAKTNQELVEKLKALEASRAPASSVDEDAEIATLMFDNPKLAIKRIEERASRAAEERIGNKLNQRDAVNSQIQQAAASAHAIYPELGDSNSEAFKLAMQKYNAMSAEEKTTPTAVKAALLEAAAEIGLTPASKRKAKEAAGDEFALSGKASGSNSGNPRAKAKGGTEGISEKSLAFAQLVGMDINDPKVLEGLKKQSQRKNWSGYR
jgi:CO dehydrogenase/acetyl-CoA synthase beta subunit